MAKIKNQKLTNQKLNNALLTQSFFLIPLILMLIVTYISAFDEHGQPVCDRYLLNSYLYAITYLFMMAWFVSLLVVNDFNILNVNLFLLLGLAIFFIALVFIIHSIPKEMILLKHFVSVVLIGLLAILSSFLLQLFDIKSIVFFIVMTIILFVILAEIAWQYQDMISSKLSFLMLIIFFILLIFELIIGVFFPGSMLEKAIVLIVLMFLSYILLLKTKRMIEDSKTCVADSGPDYVDNGIGLVISFYNILIRLLELFGKKKSFGRRR